MNTNKKSGETAECYFDYLAMSKGIVVSEPRGDLAPYDRIVEMDGRLTKVQIKMTTTIANERSRRYARIFVSRNKNKAYLATEVDIFAIYSQEEESWYFLPFEDAKLSVTINDSLNKYKNNWEVFK